MNKPKLAAFFDFDNTLLVCESAEIGLRWAWKNNETSIIFILKMLLSGLLYKLNLFSAEITASIALNFYKGKNLKEYEEQAPDYYNKYIRPELSQKIMAIADHHRKSGHLLVLVSGSPCYLLKHVREDLNFDHLICTELESDENGLGTGRSNGPICVGIHKKRAVLKFAQSQGIELKNSYAYADHDSDAHLMEIVGNPVAVRPNKKLKKKAEKNNWKIIQN